ncbi:AAA domain-containing protein [Streptomyces bohaiensis]|uniref:AAA domain-containing protein n=1 Tax=Streptomyces bohaiensis TaxID=1431344 RepID=UPI003B7B56B7
MGHDGDSDVPPPGIDSRRVQQIFRFLADAEESKARPKRTLDGVAGIVWFDDLPSDPAVSVVLDAPLTEGAPAWLRVERPAREEAPALPELIELWVEETGVRDFRRTQAPVLLRRIEPQFPDWSEGVPLEKSYDVLEDHPQRERIEKTYEAWRLEWLGWAERRRAMDPQVELYDRLHKMHEEAAELGEAYELVLGLGRLTWQTEAGQRVERHLVTHRAVLTLDSASGALSAGPDPLAMGPELEEGMLDGGQHVAGSVREQIVARLADAGDLTAATHLTAVHDALRVWVNAAHAAGAYHQGISRARPATPESPQVGLTPALVLRERDRSSTLDALKTIARAVDEGVEPTELLAHIAGRGGSLTAVDHAAGEDDPTGGEVFFALPANDEQRTIARRLRANRLVVVQGPPGTGKTHTIANLVTDLLAQGKRVLITSHTARALRVLRDKLPDTVRDLCVSRTEDGSAAQRELEASVQRILREYATYDPGAAEREISSLRTRLDRARDAQRVHLADLAVLRNQETHRFEPDIGDYAGSLQEIAQRLVAETEAHRWLGPVPTEQPSLTAEEALELLRATRAFTAERQALAAEVPGPAELPGPGDFDRAVATTRQAFDALERARANEACRPYDEAVRGLTSPELHRISERLDAFTTACARAADLAEGAGSWAVDLEGEARRGRDRRITARRDGLVRALDDVSAASATIGPRRVAGLEAHSPQEALAPATLLSQGLADGGRLRGPFGLRTRLAKSVGTFADTVTVDGRPPHDAEAAAVVHARVLAELGLCEAETEWYGESRPWQGLASRVARIQQDLEVLDALCAVVRARIDLGAVGAAAPGLTDAPWQEKVTREAVRDLLRAAVGVQQAESGEQLLNSAEQLLSAWTDRPGCAAAVTEAHAAVRDRDTERYRQHCETLSEVREAARFRAEQHAAHARVDAAFPHLAERIVTTPEDPAWDQQLPRLAQAWAWTAWRERLERLTDPQTEEKLLRQLTEADDEARITLGRLAARRAWHQCLRLLTDDQSRALKAYQQAAGRIRGKYQQRYRKDAQLALAKAQSAVPAWIMPLHQVAETVPMDRPGLFDVVIVDEASQSGLEAMLLSWLADRMVVVGDSKQVSPENVGLKREDYFQLRDRLLTALEPDIRSLFGPDSSFFDLTEALSSGRGTLMLKEHFRCMPEIISFSNELCYSGDLLPLRQFGADRLPPVRTVEVPDGEATGTGNRLVNHAEVEALVDAVARSCADPAYAGLTMGVIVLRSAVGHATELENLLAERIGYEQREQRRLRVGDAAAFQGDERDVVFISCVNSASTAAGTVPGGFNGSKFEQRLNVAASRARDQVWVFHSARADQFHAGDLRRHWLDHLSRPLEAAPEQIVDGEVRPDVRHPAFDNLFQQLVYREITARGFRVRPGYRVGGHALDLVVEGGSRRLAVCCDGDSFAEGEDAETAARRQRDLERVDWVFVRIRASRFHLDRERALAPLWRRLGELGIEPVPSEPAPSGPGGGGAPAGAERMADAADPVQQDAAVAGEPTGKPVTAGATVEAVADDGTLAVEASSPDPTREPVPYAVLRRVMDEMRQLEAVLSATDDPLQDETDAARVVFLRRTLREQRERRARHLGVLRSFSDTATVDPALQAPAAVVPGALVSLEFDGRWDREVLYTVAELPCDDAETISPSSPLGSRLLWQTVGTELAYEATPGKPSTVRVREVSC